MSFEPNEPFGGGGGGGEFCSNACKRGRYHAGRSGSPDDAVTATLYVETVPRSTTEECISPLFEEYGNVFEVIFPRDKWTANNKEAVPIKVHSNGDVLVREKGNTQGCDEPVIVRFADPIKRRTRELRFSFLYIYAFIREIMHLVDKIFGPCFHEPMIRPTPNFRDSMGGVFLPNASYSMHEISQNLQPQTVSHAVELTL
ncbi:hypothetical protein GH714_022494 [Hevea brasiliensis]|uniref:RRM domain-containing protein n=1 Tax=Hevea brasiliensis TaxID=3981 RepID=A0A6A6NIN4_HEVBR|nr:hypothetical protein GH714_022494 [Hevea brasiliensis]